MSNFIEEFKKGQKGSNKGIPFGPGLDNLTRALNGVQKHTIYGIGSPPKVGKSTFTDYSFVLSPYLFCIENNINIEWIYFSFEIDRVSKKFDFMTFFLYNDYNIGRIKLEDNQTYKGESVIELSSHYLRGRLLDDDGNLIVVKESVLEAIKTIYTNRIIPLFGEYSKSGVQIKKGLITFIEDKDNPTGLRNYLLAHARKEGRFVSSTVDSNNRISGYHRNPDVPDKYTIIITDHLRKLQLERGFTLKQTVDKYIDYTIEFRNWCDYTFVHIIHTNRSLADVENMKFNKETLYPTSETVKDTGNLSEDVDYMLTMFNPNDDKYKIYNHFDLPIRDKSGNIYYPDMRTIHLVESRHCIFPQHFRTVMKGNLKAFMAFEQQ